MSALTPSQPPSQPETPKSHDLLARARQVIPGGVNSPVRAFAAVEGEPLFMARGEGPWIWDADGNRYLDLIGSWGPLILGHAHPEVLAEVTAALQRGSSFGCPTEAEVLFAEELCAAHPALEQVRLCSSGTEATMHAVRLARGGHAFLDRVDRAYRELAAAFPARITTLDGGLAPEQLARAIRDELRAFA